MAINTVVMSGRLTKEPELKSTTNGKYVTNFSLAVDRKFEKDATDFFNVVAWNKTAEYICSYAHKGSELSFEGSAQTRSYDDKDGKKHTLVEFIANSVTLHGGKSNSASIEYEAPVTTPSNDEEELPF